MNPVKLPVTRPAPDLVSIDDLHSSIVSLAARINAETYELLVLVREFDERAGWLACRCAPSARSVAAAGRLLEISALAEVAAGGPLLLRPAWYLRVLFFGRSFVFKSPCHDASCGTVQRG